MERKCGLQTLMRSQPLHYSGRQIGDLCGKFSRQILFPLAMATKMVAA